MSFQDFGYFLVPCALFIADSNPWEPCVSRSLETGITFLILSYFKAKRKKNVFRVVRFHTVMLFSFDIPLNFLKSSLAAHYVAYFFSLLSFSSA